LTDPNLPNFESIRSVLEASSRGPLKAKELAREFDLPTEAYRDFKEALVQLEKEGKLYRNRRNRYALPDQIHLAIGELRLTRAGDGFLRPDDPTQEDVFIPSGKLDTAMDGDRLAVRIEQRPRGRNPVGAIVKILERGRPTVVGTYRRSTSFGFVSPLDHKVHRDIMIPDENRAGASDGDVVLVRITNFGSTKRNAVGEVTKVLGPMEKAGVDVLAILHGHGLPKEFPKEVLRAADEAADRIDAPGDREDLRDLEIFTIDPADAKDHDDALSLTKVSDGLWEVGIHIADVSHFVQEGTALDLEARGRGTSVYLVDQVVPMLPPLLSTDLCSLRDGVDRFVLSLFVTLDEAGRVRSHRYARGIARSRHSLHYGQVQEVLTGKGSLGKSLDGTLKTLHDLAEGLRRKRNARGSLDFDLPEARVVLDDEGAPIDIQRVVQLEAHRLIESFMLLANELVAQDCLERKLPVPFRVHESPVADRVETLREFLKPFGHSLGKKAVTPRLLQSILKKVEGRAEESLVSTVILRSMARARYDEENLGHFGLASEAYLHFTSPIRRYPDLMVHRVVSQVLIDGEDPPERWAADLSETAESVSERERKAQQAERDSVDMKKIEYMSRHLGDDFQGTIAGVVAFGFFVLLDQVFVEGLVHISTLEDDYYNFVPESFALVGSRSGRRFRVGDRVRIRVARADKEERQIDFQLLEGPDGRASAGGGGKKGKGKGGGRSRKGGRKGRRR
jgi:ribonuclease R